MSEKKEYSVNVRITSSENKILSKTAETLRVSKSEIVRMTMGNELEKFESKPRKTISQEAQIELMKMMAKIVNFQRAQLRELTRVGNNLNQLAKTENTKKKSIAGTEGFDDFLKNFEKNKNTKAEPSEEIKELKKTFDEMVVNNEDVAKGVQEIWQLLV